MKKQLNLFVSALLMFGLGLNIDKTYALSEETISPDQIIKNDSTGIPDKILYARALEIGDINQDKILTVEEAQQMTYLSIYSEESIDFKGIEYMEGLQNIDIQMIYENQSQILNFNKIESLKNLDNLSLRGIKQLDIETISKLTTLTNLSLNNNDLTNISSLSHLSQLNKLYLDGNNIKDISCLSNLKKLTLLNLSYNQITDISAVSGLTELTQLDVHYNQLESLPNLKALIHLDFDAIYKGSGPDPDERFKTNFSSNRITREELINKLPDTVKNKDEWLDANRGKPREESMGLPSGEEFPTQTIITLLNDDWVKGVSLNSYGHLSTIPKNVLDEIRKTKKYLFIFNDTFETSWILASDNIQSIQGDLSLDIEMKSPYEEIIKKATGLDRLMFMTFKANETIGYTEVIRFDESGSPIEMTIENKLFKQENKEKTIYTYSFNPVTGNIKKIGSLLASDRDTINIQLLLEKNANTIFISDKDGLENINIKIDDDLIVPDRDEKPITPEISVENKVIECKDGISNQDIQSALNDKEVKQVTVNLTQSDTISYELLNSIQLSQKEITFNVLDNNNKVKYSWSFNGKDINLDNDMTLNLNIEFKSDKQDEISKLTNQQDIFYLQFAYHGKLPAPATMNVDVSSQYKDGDSIYLYYFNEEKNSIEKTGSLIKVKNGYAQFTIDHCSTYFFSKDENVNSKQETEKSKETVKTSDSTNVFMILSITLIGLAGIVILKKEV